MRIWRFYANLLGLALSVSASAHAQSADAETSESEGEFAEVGDTFDALPGIHRVGIAGLPAPRFSAATSASYGYTEAQNGEDSPHHRIGASAAASVSPWSSFSAALRFDFRHDMHGDDPIGGDSGSIMDLTPILRGGHEVSPGFHLGAEAKARFTGAALANGFPTPDFDIRALASYLDVPTWAFALHAGYRLGQGGDGLEEAENLRPGDRVVLGISEFDALLIGLGATKKLGKTEFLGEMTWDLLVGSGAPSPSESPFRLSAGIRQSLSRNLLLQAIVEVLPLSRAPSLSNSPLVPIEPRFTAQIGLVFRLEPREKPPAEGEEEKAEEVKQKANQKTAPTVVAILPGSIRLTIVDHTGHPISDATAQLQLSGKDGEAPRKLAVPLQSGNVYLLEELMPASGVLTIKAELLHSYSQKVEVLAGEELNIEVTLQSEGSRGSQLRGLVRSYSGGGLEASIEVNPGGHKVVCNPAGEFEIDLPPGKYEVTITAEGYAEQRRKLTVGKDGVTVLNADLQRSGK